MNGAAMAHDDAEHMVDEHDASEFESAATLFAEDVFGTNAGDYGIAFAPDGDTLYFTRTLPGSLSEAIHVMRRSNDGWSEPQVAAFSGDYQEKEPYVSPDGERIYFASRRPLRGSSPKKDFDIWYVERRGDSWGEPVNLAAVNSSFNEDYPAVAADHTLLFTRNNGDNNVNLYVAYARNGRLLEPQDMGWPINTVYADADPLIAPDGSYFVFSSSRLFDGAQGQGDLYVVRREGDGWSEPVSLGLQVNNIGHDYGPAMSPDGLTFYFSRGFGGRVWMVPTALLDGFSNSP
jgi:Tol biopolymer transport system component